MLIFFFDLDFHLCAKNFFCDRPGQTFFGHLVFRKQSYISFGLSVFIIVFKEFKESLLCKSCKSLIYPNKCTIIIFQYEHCELIIDLCQGIN